MALTASLMESDSTVGSRAVEVSSVEFIFRKNLVSATIPPSYGNDTRGSREGSNHWRVMKDPIRIQTKQLLELERLIRDRIAPPDDPIMPCKPDTAAKVSEDGRVDVARPLQYTDDDAYDVTFCECKDWPSKWPEDRAWCAATEEVEERLYQTTYNFETDGF